VCKSPDGPLTSSTSCDVVGLAMPHLGSTGDPCASLICGAISGCSGVASHWEWLVPPFKKDTVLGSSGISDSLSTILTYYESLQSKLVLYHSRTY